MDLRNIWRELNGDERKFTYYSSVHNSYSRIDFMFISQNLISKVVDTNSNVIKVTEHALMVMEMEVKKDYREAKRWRIDSNIFQYPDVLDRVKKEWLEIWSINEAGGSKIGVLWDIIK